jgi:hypothetical protein
MANGAASVPANPAPLGLAGFGLTTVVLSSINAGLLTGDVPRSPPSWCHSRSPLAASASSSPGY